MIFFSQLHQCSAQQRAVCQVKRKDCLLCRQSYGLDLSLRLRKVAEVHQWQRKSGWRMDQLNRPAVHDRKAGAPCFVPPDNFIQALLKSCHVERTG